MKAVWLLLLGALMFAGAIALSVFGPDLSDGQQAAVLLFGGGGVVAFYAGLEEL